MIPPILSNKNYVLRLSVAISVIVILADFIVLNLGIQGIFNWKLHLITALYSFAITLVNLAYFDFLNKKFDAGTSPNRRVLTAVFGGVLVTVPTYFISRLIDVVGIRQIKTL
ncbi:hypothetical protein N9954_03665 [Maribacter sp.]|nr:hypothetical protein [Maribacter sp.]